MPTIEAAEIVARMSAEQQSLIKARAAELMAEERTLRDLRKAMALTQVDLSETLGITQENISRLEKRSDMLLSTLSSYVAAMGGTLRLVAEFPGRTAVRINLGEIGSGNTRVSRRSQRAGSVGRLPARKATRRKP